MDPERWIRIKNVFQQAIELQPADRAAFLDRECGTDNELKTILLKMIEADQRANNFLERPLTLTSVAGETVPIPDERIGTCIGGYTIIDILGEGGMGTVYLAERKDETFHRIAALKIVRHGMDTRTILQRFFNERQILANLDHPNIARLIDGGMTDDDLPYFIMEYVDGKPITEYCDQKQATIRERLDIFITVCEAVQYAHRNLIVHRDIKPSNILVTEDGKVKLLDFGIAKMLSAGDSPEESTLTSATFPVMTPEYASPEQIKGGPVTTASDVYSLGVLLYELLSGHRPYDIKTRTPVEIERTITSTHPVKPSVQILTHGTNKHETEEICKSRSTTIDRLRRSLTGDLDNIVMMALRKEHPRRYQSAEQLLTDITRYRNNLPVSARPDTMWYRTSKFVRRHTYGVAAAIAIFIVLITGIISTARQAHIATEAKIAAEEQRIIAERRFNEVRELARRFMFDFHDQIEHLAGSRTARELLVSTALEYLERLADEAGDDRDLLSELASAYVRLGDIQGNPYTANLGNTAGALKTYSDALDILRNLVSIEPENIDYLRSMAHTLNKIGDLQQWAGNTDQALESFGNAKEILTHISDMEPENRNIQQELAASLVKTGDAYSWHGHNEDALPHYTGALEIVERIARQDPENIGSVINLSVGHSKVGYALTQLGDLDSALIHHLTAFVITEELSEKHPEHARLRRSVAINANQVGAVYMAKGDPGAALPQFHKALSIVLHLQDADPGDPLISSDVTYTRNKIGEALTELGDLYGALAEFKAACAIREKLVKNDPRNEGFQRDLAVSMSLVAQTYIAIAENYNRIEDWRSSKEWFTGSLQILIGMQERGTLRDGDRSKPDEFRNMIKKADERIFVLQQKSSP
jgi:eukaryotic-like serine/threonine-protein kinase